MTDDSTPVMLVKVSISHDGKVIILTGVCPFCGKVHTHGGSDNLSNILVDSRLSHCLENARGYMLVLEQ